MANIIDTRIFVRTKKGLKEKRDGELVEPKFKINLIAKKKKVKK